MERALAQQQPISGVGRTGFGSTNQFSINPHLDLLIMRYGHFDDAAKEYVITRPDTPRAWSNYLGSRRYGAVITNHAGGYSFYRSPAEGRFLRFRYNCVPAEQPGRYYYLRDAESGDYWSASWQPVGKPLDKQETTCRFGTGYAVITSRYSSIETETTYFCPLDEDLEIWWMAVTNRDSKPRRLQVLSFAEFTSEWNLMNDSFNLQYVAYIAQAELCDGIVQASSCARLPADPGNFANRDQSRWWWMTMAGAPLQSHDLDRDRFVGLYRGLHNPLAVESGRCSGSVGSSDNICGALQTEIVLQPGETRHLFVLLGIGYAGKEGARARAEFANPERAGRELSSLKQYWHRLLDRFSCETPDPEFDHMVNVWNAYNALITFTWSRSCSLVYTGDHRDGLGYRDSLQDTLGAGPLVPELVRQRLELMLSGQDATGGAQPEIKPWLHEPGKMPPTPPQNYRSDDCLWFFNSIPAYVAETGHLDFYRQTIPYADQGSDTVFAHLRRALEFNLARTGRNGLPCGLLADWNDCLKLGYHGESVFVAFQVRYGLSVYADIARLLGEQSEESWALAQRQALDEKIQRCCWDGEWFVWAVAEDGTVFGSKNYPEGQIYLNTQVWAVISGAATAAQRDTCMDSVNRRLATPYGVMICEPPFEKTPVKVMRAVLMNPGNKENGGIFSHTQSWAVMAEVMRGQGDRAFEYYRSFMPSAYNDRAELREIEPYVHCQSTHSRRSPKYGASRVPWLSGTATWSYYTATQWILGIRPEADGLRLDPCIPAAWSGFKVRRVFRDKTLDIEVKNPHHVCRGVVSVTVDEQPVAGAFVPFERLRDGARLVVVMG